jgi:hypothetical protein
VDLAVQALVSPPPPFTTNCSTDGSTWIANGNLKAYIESGSIVFVRLNDNYELLRTQSILLEPFDNPNATQPQYEANITFSFTPGDKIYGLGEHRTGAVAYTDFYHKLVQISCRSSVGDLRCYLFASNSFQTSQEYPISHGSDIMIP